jgi:hypothetical protein
MFARRPRPTAKKDLLARLESSRARERLWAASVIAERPEIEVDQAIRDALLQALRDDRQVVRFAAGTALTRRDPTFSLQVAAETLGRSAEGLTADDVIGCGLLHHPDGRVTEILRTAAAGGDADLRRSYERALAKRVSRAS